VGALLVQPEARAGQRGLWARATLADGSAASCWWEASAESARRAPLRLIREWPVLHGLLSALWHDLCVPIVESSPAPTTDGPSPPAGPASRPGPARGHERTVSVPFHVRRMASPAPTPFEWASDAERGALRRASSVAHGFRRLPAGWQAREAGREFQRRQAEARRRALQAGCDLPAGYTFVSDYIRGGRAEGEETTWTAPVHVRSQGLLRLVITLRQVEEATR
jgi:hypothetical protein